SLQEAHAPLSPQALELAAAGRIVPELITQATAYPDGRMVNLLIRGIPPGQQLLSLPTAALAADSVGIPALIGRRMAASLRLQPGDALLLRWRDRSGVFDAREVTIVGIFRADVPSIDQGQIWLPLATVQEMTGMAGEATLLVSAPDQAPLPLAGWVFKDTDFLLKEFTEVIHSKKAGSSIIYGTMLAIALLAIFDTQVLSIFRRRREIGTYMALGMTRGQVIGLFTVEGAAHSLFALLLASIYGLPLLHWLGTHGISMPEVADATGMTIGDKMLPVYSAGMVLFSVAVVILSTAIVSYLPARRIARLKPTEALRGRSQ
ncbi:MAG TPA: FtsX-like permease family protein, partial [bacterium]|nr:FtsX-like permease family protein [bacterium]